MKSEELTLLGLIEEAPERCRTVEQCPVKSFMSISLTSSAYLQRFYKVHLTDRETVTIEELSLGLV